MENYGITKKINFIFFSVRYYKGTAEQMKGRKKDFKIYH
jgi:hypothetical protein